MRHAPSRIVAAAGLLAVLAAAGCVRQVLSGCPVGFAASTILRSHAGNGAVAMATAGPTGYSPAQIRHAYGFDSISFAGAAADGAAARAFSVDASRLDSPTPDFPSPSLSSSPLLSPASASAAPA